jgi:hypothetical protein
VSGIAIGGTTATPRAGFLARQWVEPVLWLEVFLLGNVAFLAVDILIAHKMNDFAHPGEWIPVGYSAVATLMLLAAWALGGIVPRTAGPRGLSWWLGALAGMGGVVVGVAGLIFHLDSDFFALQTIKSLVYTAPFVAPLAYAGVGLLLLLNRMVEARSTDWARWVLLLTAGGFVGNFVLSLADHAQNGFFEPAEWTGVVAAAVAVGILFAVVVEYRSPTLRAIAAVVMVGQMLVGLAGFAFHLRGNLLSPIERLADKFIFGSPVFAPLLFANLAVLGLIGLWALGRALAREAGRDAA